MWRLLNINFLEDRYDVRGMWSIHLKHLMKPYGMCCETEFARMTALVAECLSVSQCVVWHCQPDTDSGHLEHLCSLTAKRYSQNFFIIHSIFVWYSPENLLTQFIAVSCPQSFSGLLHVVCIFLRRLQHHMKLSLVSGCCNNIGLFILHT